MGKLKTLGYIYIASFKAEKGIPSTAKSLLALAELDAKQLSTAARVHGSVTNNFHWQLDVAMNEDPYRIRISNSTEKFSPVRHVAFNLLKIDVAFKGGIKET